MMGTTADQFSTRTDFVQIGLGTGQTLSGDAVSAIVVSLESPESAAGAKTRTERAPRWPAVSVAYRAQLSGKGETREG